MSAIIPKRAPKDFVGIISKYTKSLRELKKVDPKTRYVMICPNWENAYVGMGFNLLNTTSAEQVFEQANTILNKDIFRLCLEGPKPDLLDSYENKSLATYVTSHAVIAKLASERPEVIPLIKGAGGIGVGLVNSLVFSGAMSFEDGLGLVQRLGRAMDKVAKIVPTAKIIICLRPANSKGKICMAAIEHCVKQGIAPEIAVCNVSRQLPLGKVEIAGHQEAINYLEREGPNLFEFKWMKRVLRDPHASHTQLMRPVSDFLQFYIDQKLKENNDYIKDPDRCSVYSATSGQRLRYANNVKRDLCKYPVSTLKIQSLMSTLFQRDTKVAQPNVFVLWDKKMYKHLSFFNRKAYASAEFLKA